MRNIGDVLKQNLMKREVITSLVMLLVLTYLAISYGLSIIFSTLIIFSIFSIVTLSLNLEVGHTGISQFGRVLAVIAGAFVVGAIPGRILAFLYGLPFGLEYADDAVNYKVVPLLHKILEKNIALALGFFLFCLVLAGLSGALIGWLTSRPAIRLREAYLGISLLAFGDFFMWVGHNYEPLVGGTTAVFIPDPFRIVWDYRMQAVAFTFLAIAVLVYLFIERITKSPFGRTLKMLRDSPLVSRVYGKNIVKIRTQSLVIGSAIAGIGGALYVIYTGTCTAIGFTRLTWTFWPWAYMMLGGIGSNIGMVVGVLVLTVLRTLIILYRKSVFGFLLLWGIDPIWLEYTLLGLVIIFIVLFMPYGLVPEKSETVLPSGRIKAILESVRKQSSQTPEK